MTPNELADALDKKIDAACIFPYEIVLKRNDASRVSYAIRCLQKQKQQLETELFKHTQSNTQLRPLTDEEILCKGRGCALEDDWERLEFARAILRKAQEK